MKKVTVNLAEEFWMIVKELATCLGARNPKKVTEQVRAEFGPQAVTRETSEALLARVKELCDE